MHPEFRVTILSEYISQMKYMVMFLDQNSGRNHDIKIDNSSFESIEEFKYLETTLIYWNSIQEDIERRLKSENAYYLTVNNLLSYSMLSKNTKIKIHRTVILLVVLYWCETWSLTLKEERRLRVNHFYCPINALNYTKLRG
jgi:hypothetical protein